MKLNLVEYIVKPFTRADIKKAIEDACRMVEDKMKIEMSAYDELLEAVIVFDNEDNVIDCNISAYEMFEYNSKDEMIGLSASFLALENKTSKTEARKNKIHTENETYLIKKDKSRFLARTNSKIIKRESQELRIVSVLDISSIHKFGIDTLTKLKTKRLFELEFENIMKKCFIDNEPTSLIFLSLENIDMINEESSFELADNIVIKIADILLYGVRGSDTVVRWGDNEFMVLLINSSLHQAKKIAEGLRKSLDEIYTADNITLKCMVCADSVKYEDTISNLSIRMQNTLFGAKTAYDNCVEEHSLVK